MQSSIFNLRVPLPGNDVFLMNTLTDAQVIVSSDVADLLDSGGETTALDAEGQAAFDLLCENGFLVPSREHDRRELDNYLSQVKSDRTELNVTVLTTLQCNFACDYCYQGDRGDYNKFAEKMSMETAQQVIAWIEQRLDELHPGKFVMTLFGGEPLLNLPVAYYLAEQTHRICSERGVPQFVNM